MSVMEGNASIVDAILTPDEESRLFELLFILQAAETNSRSVGLMLRGLSTKIEGLMGDRDLASALALVDTIAARYSSASDEVLSAISRKQTKTETVGPLLH